MVKLKPHDLEIIIEILQQVCDYKHQALRPQSWLTFQRDWLSSAIEQIKANEFILHHAEKNFFAWLIDQVCWSRRLTPGLDHRSGVSLADTKLGAQAIDICRRASQGQRAYDNSNRDTKFRDLFIDD